MKWTWILVPMAALGIPAMALADGPTPEPTAAWCGGSYGVGGTNFGGCVSVDTNVQVAGESSGVKQSVSVPTTPEYPATMVSFEGGKAMFDTGNVDKDGQAIKQELNLMYVPTADLSQEIQGGD
jgi:hypothetical protein